MSGMPLDEAYLRWLYSLVADSKAEDRSQTYWTLLKQLFTTEYLWFVEHDGDRAEDGIALRREFLAEQAIDPQDVDPDWIGLECSILELMVGLSRRLEFQAGGQPHYWFWRLVENIGLLKYNDAVRRYPRLFIDGVLHSLIFRQYTASGLGGLFPLCEPKQDQRNVDLWYQLSAYVLEQT